MSRPQPTKGHRFLSPSWLAAGLLPVVLAASACGAFSRQPGTPSPEPRENQRGEEITVHVQNNAWETIHVYALAGGQWESLGVVSSQNSSDYTIPRGMLGGRSEIRLVADPIGSNQGFFSEPILVEPGDRVEWTLQNNLALSSVFVR